MPQANTIDLEAFEAARSNLDLILDRRGGDHYYPPQSSSYASNERHRERTYSLPTRPSFHGSSSQAPHHPGDPQRRREGDDVDSDPVERMRKNLERTTFLLSNLKVSLAPKPEDITILPSRSDSSSSLSSTSSSDSRDAVPAPPESMARHHSEPQKHSSSYYDSHPPPPPPSSYPRKPSHNHSHSSSHTHNKPHTKSKPLRLVAPGMERSDSNATAFSIAVSTYAPGDAGRPQPDDHGSEFHQLINHGRLHNPSRGGMLRRQAVMSAYAPPTAAGSRGLHHPGPERRDRERASDREKENNVGKDRERDRERKQSHLSRQLTPYPASSKALVPAADVHMAPRNREHGRRHDLFEPAPKIVSRPFPPEYLPYAMTPSPDVPDPRKRGHGRSASVSHPPRDPPAVIGSGRRKIPDMGMRRVRFDF